MLMKHLSEIVRCGYLFMNRKLKDRDCSYPEHYILMFLSGGRCVNQETIASYFMVDKGAVARMLGKMEEKGLISRAENPENHREKLVCLTETGKEKFKSMPLLREEWEQIIFEGISAEELEAFHLTLEKLAENAKKAV